MYHSKQWTTKSNFIESEGGLVLSHLAGLLLLRYWAVNQWNCPFLLCPVKPYLCCCVSLSHTVRVRGRACEDTFLDFGYRRLPGASRAQALGCHIYQRWLGFMAFMAEVGCVFLAQNHRVLYTELTTVWWKEHCMGIQETWVLVALPQLAACSQANHLGLLASLASSVPWRVGLDGPPVLFGLKVIIIVTLPTCPALL